MQHGAQRMMSVPSEYGTRRSWSWGGVLCVILASLGFGMSSAAAVTADPLATVTLSAHPGTTVMVNRRVTLTATAVGGTQVEYKFQLGHPDATGEWQYTTLQDYSPASTCQWIPSTARRVTAIVFAREAGQTAFTAYSPLDLTVTGGMMPMAAGDHPADATATLSANPVSPQDVNTPVTLTGMVGERTDINYWFRVGYPNPDTTWTWFNLQAYSDYATCAWTPGDVRHYTIAVYVKEQGCPAPQHGNYDAYASAYYSTKVSAVTLAAAPASPQVINTPIVLTATPQPVGVEGRLEYQFRVNDGTGWTTPQPYTEGAASFTYTPRRVATHTFATDVRTVGGGSSTVRSAGLTNYSVIADTTPPTAVADQYTVNEDTLLTKTAAAGVLQNDTSHGQTLTTTLVSGPAHAKAGTFVLNADGAFTYQAEDNWFGTDTFTYTANDGTFTSNTATVTLTVNAVNDPPAFIKGGDQTVNEDCSSADTTVQGWATGISAGPANESTQALNFIVTYTSSTPDLFAYPPTITSNGRLTYSPSPNAFGTALVTVKLHDNGGGTDTSIEQTFTITIRPVNDAPSFSIVAQKLEQLQYLYEDIGTSVTVPGLMIGMIAGPANESSQTLYFTTTYEVIQGSTNFFAILPTVTPDGTLSFKLADNAFGAAEIVVILHDNGGTDNGGKDTYGLVVPILVEGQNDAPVAVNDAFSATEDTELRIIYPNVLINDDDPDDGSWPPTDIITAAYLSSPPEHAKSFDWYSNGSFTYVPEDDWYGTDTFTYWVTDGYLASNEATVTIIVAPTPDAPNAVNDYYEMDEDASICISNPGVLANDTDVDFHHGESTPSYPLFSVILIDGPTYAQYFGLGIDGSFVYTPVENWYGVDTFTYVVQDADTLLSEVATVTIAVSPRNDLPKAHNISVNTDEDVAVTIHLDATDIDGDNINYVIDDGPDHGLLLQLHGDEHPDYRYIPDTNWFGTDTFTYHARDGVGSSNIATVIITVNPTADLPSVSITSPADCADYTSPTSISITAEAVDPDDPVSSVQFYVNNQPIGTPDTQAPFSVSWSGMDYGTYTLTAKVIGDTGEEVVSEPVSIMCSRAQRGRTITFGYSYNNISTGELTSVQDGAKTPTIIAYNPDSGLVETVTTPKPGTTNGDTVQTSLEYDDLGNLVSITLPGNNATSTMTVLLDYTTDGTYQQVAAFGQPLTVTDGLGHVTHYRYTTRGRRSSVTDADAHTTDFQYNIADQLTQISYPATGKTGPGRERIEYSYLYPGGQRIRSDLFDESNSATPTRTVNFQYGNEGESKGQSGDAEVADIEYDALYRVIGLTDGKGNRTDYEYDIVGHLVKVMYPPNTPGGARNTSQVVSFDPAGRVLERVDGNGVSTFFGYNDPDGLLTDIIYPQHTTRNVEIAYDEYARVETITDGVGVRDYTYDHLDNPLTIESTIAGLPQKTLSYTYYPNGSRESMTVPTPSGYGVNSYLYDAAGRLTSLINPFNQTTTWEYNDNNTVQRRTLSNGAYSEYAWTVFGQLTSLNNTLVNHTLLSQYTNFTFNGMHDRTGHEVQIPGLPEYCGQWAYQYNTTGQVLGGLTAEAFLPVTHAPPYQTGFTNTFAYDEAGNATTFRGQGHAYNNNNQHMGREFFYDGNGNPTTYRSQSLTFDEENRLTGYGLTFAAGYYAEGLRAWKGTTGNRTFFLYDGELPVCELDESGAVTAVNTVGMDGLVSRTISSGVQTRTICYLFDPQGNVAHRLDAQGAVLASDVYDAYGRLLTSQTPTGQNYDFADDPYGYEGQYGYYTDAETGLILCTLRYYDPELGRFITRDPIGYLGGMNLYGYCGGNPVNFVDPEGTIAPLVTGLIGGAVGGLFSGILAAIHGEDWKKAALVGAITGAISGATFNPMLGYLVGGQVLGAGAMFAIGGAAGAITGCGGGLVGGFAGEMYDIVGLGDSSFDVYDIGTNTLGGFIGGACGGAFGGVAIVEATELSTLDDLLNQKWWIGMKDCPKKFYTEYAIRDALFELDNWKADVAVTVLSIVSSIFNDFAFNLNRRCQ